MRFAEQLHCFECFARHGRRISMKGHSPSDHAPSYRLPGLPPSRLQYKPLKDPANARIVVRVGQGSPAPDRLRRWTPQARLTLAQIIQNVFAASVQTTPATFLKRDSSDSVRRRSAVAT